MDKLIQSANKSCFIILKYFTSKCIIQVSEVRLYKTVLMFGSETWLLMEKDIKRPVWTSDIE